MIIKNLPNNESRIYYKSWCPFSIKAIRKFINYNHKGKSNCYDIEKNEDKEYEMYKLTKKTSVPQIWIDGKYIGGCNEFMDYLNNY